MRLNTIYLGDCIEGMKALPDDSVDLMLTSPPFKDEDVEEDYACRDRDGMCVERYDLRVVRPYVQKLSLAPAGGRGEIAWNI